MWTKKETSVSLTHIHVDAHTLQTKTFASSFTFIRNLPLFDLKGAAIAKKKMMKKFGWYKHSEDGGGTSAATVCYAVMFILRDAL